MTVSDLLEKLKTLDGELKIEILVKPINGQLAIAAIREPWDDDILLYETGVGRV